GGRVGDRHDDLDPGAVARQLGADAAEFAARVGGELAILLWVHIGGMRIEPGEHALQGVARQLVVGHVAHIAIVNDGHRLPHGGKVARAVLRLRGAAEQQGGAESGRGRVAQAMRAKRCHRHFQSARIRMQSRSRRDGAPQEIRHDRDGLQSRACRRVVSAAMAAGYAGALSRARSRPGASAAPAPRAGSVRPVGSLEARRGVAARILPPVEQHRDGDRLLTRRVVDLGQTGIFDAVDRALEDRGDLPRADPGRRAPAQMKALADFDFQVPAHSLAAKSSQSRRIAGDAAGVKRPRRMCPRYYFFLPVFLAAAFFLARPGLRRARTGAEALNFTVTEAGIFSASPVIRLRPRRAPRLALENVPSGVRIEPPLTTVFSMVLNTASTAARALFALLLVALATEATRSASDMTFPPG